MRISAILWCMLYSMRLIQSEKCCSRHFKFSQGHKLDSTPVKSITVDSEILCAMKSMREDWCQAMNVIKRHNSEDCVCEMFTKDEIRSGQIIKNESSVYYLSLQVKDTTNEPHKNVSSMGHTPTSVTSSSVTSSPSPTVPISTTPLTAVACKKRFQDDPASIDGSYTIFLGTANEAQVFCDMTGALTGCGGGGWTLVMRIDGAQQTFKYSAELWTNKLKHGISHGQNLESSFETKLSTYYTTPFTQICLGMSINKQKGWTTVPLASTSLFDLISNNLVHETSLAVSDWRGLIPSGTSLQLACRVQGINVVRGDTGVRIGLLASKTCGVPEDYNSRLGFGAKGNSCGQDGTNTCGNDARCDGDQNAKSTKTMGYILVK